MADDSARCHIAVCRTRQALVLLKEGGDVRADLDSENTAGYYK